MQKNNLRIKSRLCVVCSLSLSCWMEKQEIYTAINLAKAHKCSGGFTTEFGSPPPHHQHSPWEWRSVERCVSLQCQCLVTSSSCCVRRISQFIRVANIQRTISGPLEPWEHSPVTTQTRFPRISGLRCFLEKNKAHFLTEKAAVRIIDYRWGHWHWLLNL